MIQLRLLLLGPPRIERNGQILAVDTRKATALLAYLALQPRFRKLFADITDSQGFAASQLLDAQLPAIKAPTLILWGKNDPFFTPSGAEAFLKDLPAAKLVWLDAGHFVQNHARVLLPA